MGVFDVLLKGLGFDDDNDTKSQKESYKQDIIITSDSKEEKTSKNEVSINSLLVYSPKSNNDVKMLINYLVDGKASIVNLGNLKPVEKTRILDFLSGAVYAVNGKINRLQNDLFVILPKNINLTTV